MPTLITSVKDQYCPRCRQSKDLREFAPVRQFCPGGWCNACIQLRNRPLPHEIGRVGRSADSRQYDYGD